MPHATDVSELDRVNQAAWSSAAVVREFDSMGAPVNLSCFTDPGEQAALGRVATVARGRPILDVGVGGGRTTPLLRLLSDDYIAIDYTPAMVEACQHNHPDVDVRFGDVRDMSAFADSTFGLVVFSYNGLDAIAHTERMAALHEIARVLEPGGALLYSTHNLSGPSFRATPLRRAGSPIAHTWSRAFRWAITIKSLLLMPIQLPRAVRNRRRLALASIDEGHWAIAPLEAHDFSLLIHYTTMAGVNAELNSAGLALDAAFDAEHGRPVAFDSDPRDVRYFQLVARKVAPNAAT